MTKPFANRFVAVTLLPWALGALAVQTAKAQVVSLSATTIAFGNVAVGIPSARNLKITNTGTSNLTITSIVASAYFQTSNCGSASIAPNSSCTASVSFLPSATGSVTGSLTITDNASNSPQVVSLSGTGVPPVTFNPATLTFPNQAVGTTSGAKTITVVNNQTVSLTIISVTTTGNFAGSSCPATLAAQTSCTISVTFTPSALGANTGTLTVTDSANNSPQTATLTGSGVQPVTFNQTGISFGNQAVNTTSAAKTVTLTNNQSVPLNITSITSTFSSFAASTCATPIAANASCTISVTFTPASTGSITGTLTIADDASTSPQTVTLSGTGTLSVFLSPTTLQFPSQAVGSTSKAQTVVLTNSQSTSLNITSVSTTGPFAASMCPSSLASGGTCTISVTFTPTAAGNTSGTLTVVDSASSSPQTATLQGIGAAVQLTSITVTPAAPSTALGTSQQFTATGNYNNGTNSNLTNSATWTSTATSVATISTAGLASTVGTGGTTITATSGGISGSTTLTVSPAALVSIAVTPSNPSIALGTTQQFTATGTYTNGSTNNLTSSVTWTSSNTATATITSGGLATGVAVASATLTATSGSISGSTTVNVTPAVLTTITVTPLNPSIAAGMTQQFMATGTFTDGSTQNLTNSATWSSSSNAIATINSAGLAQAVSPGTLTISASSGSVTGTDNLTVTAAVLTSIAVTPANPSIPLGTAQQFTATGTFADGSTQDLTSTATWTVTVSSVADLNSTGLATSASTGTTAITATSGSISGSSNLTVTAATLVSIAVSPSSASIGLGSSQHFTATGTYTDGSTQNLTTTANWTSTALGVATISDAVSSQGLASAAGIGLTTITANVATISGTANLTVTSTAVLVSITVAPSTPSIPLGTSQQFTATGNFADGTNQDLTQTVTWTSSAATVAPISNTGLASSASQGMTTVTATSGSISGSTVLTVTPAALVSIAVTPANASVPHGLSIQFAATGTFTDGTQQNLTAAATWTSSTSSAMIGAGGLASTAALGTTTITATSGTISGSTLLTVTAPNLTSIAVTPANPSVAAGGTQQFTATGTYSDGSIANLTSSATWTSSATSAATINSAGLATAVAVGASTITATSGTVSGSTLMTTLGGTTVSLSATTITFGNVVVGLTSSRALSVTNTGATNLVITAVSTTGSFQATNCANPTVPPSGNCTVNVTFAPTGGGSAAGTLTITDNATNSPQTVSLSGTGLQGVSLNTTTLQFASQGVGSSSPAQTTTLFNYETTALTVTSVTTTGPFAATSCPASILAAGTCVISVTFTPTVAGNVSGTLTVVDSASSSPQTATLRGVGSAATLTSIAVSPANPSVSVGASQQFTTTGTYSNGTTANLTSSATWTSSVMTVATINSAGLATTVAAGTSTITATSGTVSGSTVLTVTAPTLVSIAVTPSNPSVPAGSPQQFTATGTYSNGTTSNLASSVTWSSSNAAAATITSSGLATGVAAGTTTITATSGSINGTTTLTVTPALTSIAITPSSPSIPVGSNQQFTATGTFADGTTQNLTKSTSWSSSNSATATINSAGLAKGVAQGMVTISATSGSITGNAALTVMAAALASITVTPTNTSVTLGTAQQFTATGTFTDGSTQNLTSTGVTWSAGGIVGGNSTVGTVSSSGLYTPPATVPNPPQVTIAATSTANPSISGAATLAVGSLLVTVSPASAQVEVGETHQFSVTVVGNSNNGVTWSVGGVAGGNSTLGTISPSGLYTAPTAIPNPSQVAVTATSVVDGVTSGSASVTVIPLITVTVSPSVLQNVAVLSSRQFTATVTGTSNAAATWSVGGLPGGNIIVGTITNTGLYTGPSLIPNPPHVNVTATSVVDPTKSASTVATLGPPPGVSVLISPVSSWVTPGQTMPFSSSVFGTTNSSVTWSVNGVVGGNATFGTISTGGLYTPPSAVTIPSQVSVAATSVANPAESATGVVTVGTTPFNATPLTDFVPGQLYQGQLSGMLYTGSNSPPADQAVAGLDAAGLVQPLDANGNPNPNGKIVLISLGMSEASDDWCDGTTSCTSYSFMGQAAASSSVNHSTLTILNGASSGTSASVWACAYGYCPLTTTDPNQYDRVLTDVLTPAGVTEAQVQVVWIQNADPSPTYYPSLPNSLADAYNYMYESSETLRALKLRWPNVQQVFFSSRIYAGYATTNQNPEPYAYEYGFSVKWLVNDQITQRAAGTIDPLVGDLLTGMPWIDWGAYLWGNGTNNIPGSQALNWAPDDFYSDGIHPSNLGVTQVGGALLNFFLTSPSTPWFRN